MTEVDERIVAMHFDNKQFEKGAKQTIKTLEELRKSCDMEGAAESLNQLGEAANNLHFDRAYEHTDKLGKALISVQSAAKKAFSVASWPISKLSSALSGLASDVRKWFGIDLARQIEQTGVSITRALSVGSMSSGFNKYTEETNSVAALYYALKDKGKSLDDVYKTLGDLSNYSDWTSYSYNQMVTALSAFVGNGLKLEESETAIEGIANAAAKAGVSVQDASFAFSNLSDAISKGKMMSEDWKSLERIRMTTEDLRKTLIETAIEVGTLNKEGMIKNGKQMTKVTTENFKNMLKTGFVTNEVMMKAFTKYADQSTKFGQEAFEAAKQARTFTDAIESIKDALSSGWRMSYRSIFGNMDEATKFWTEHVADPIIEFFDQGKEWRNLALQGWRGLFENSSGELERVGPDYRDVLIKSFDNILNTFFQIADTIKQVWTDVFGQFDYRSLIRITDAFHNFSVNLDVWLNEPLEDGTTRLDNLASILRAFLALVKRAFKIVKQVGSYLISKLAPILDTVLLFVGGISDAIFLALEGADFGTIVTTLTGTLTTLYNRLMGGPIGKIWEKITGFFSPGVQFKKVGPYSDDGYGEVVEYLESPFQMLINSVTGWFNGKIEEFKKLIHFDDIQKFVTESVAKVEAFFSPRQIGVNFSTGERIYGPFQTLLNSVTGWFNTTIEDFKKTIHFNEISEFVQEAIHEMSLFFGLEKIEVNSDGSLGYAIDSLPRIVDGLKASIKRYLDSDPFAGIRSLLGNVWSSITAAFTGNDESENSDNAEPKKTIGEKLTAIWTEVSEWFSQVNADVTKFAADVQTWEGWGTIGKWFTDTWANLSKWYTETFTPFVSGTWAGLVGWFTQANTDVWQFIVNAKNWEGWTVVGGWFTDIWNGLSGWWNDTYDPKIWENVKTFFTDLWNTISVFFFESNADTGKTGFETTLEKIWGRISSIATEISGSKTFQDISTFFSNLWNTVSTFFTDVDETTGDTPFVKFVKDAWTEITGFFEQHKDDPIVQQIGKFFGDLVTIITSFFTEVDAETGKTPFTEFIEKISGDISKFVDDTSKMLTLDNLLKTVTGLWDRITEFFAPKTGTSTDGASSAVQTPSQGFLVLASATLSDVQRAKPQLEQTVTELNTTLQSTDTLMTTAKSFIDSINTKLSEMIATVSSWNIGEQITSTFNTARETIAQFIHDVTTPVKGENGEDISPAAKFLNDLLTTIREFFEKIYTNVSGWHGWEDLAKFFTSLSEAVTSVATSIKDFTTEQVDKIASKLQTLTDAFLTPIGQFVQNYLKWAAKNPVNAVDMVLISAPLMSAVKDFAAAYRSANTINSGSLKFLEISAGIYLIVKGLSTLADLKQTGQFESALGALAALGVVLTAFYAIIKFISKKLTSVADALIDNKALSGMTGGQQLTDSLVTTLINWLGVAAILKWVLPSVVDTFSNLGKLDFGSVLAFALGMTIMVGGMVMIGAIAGKFGAKSTLEGTVAAIGAMLLVLNAINIAGGLLSTPGTIDNFKGFGAAIGALIGSLTGAKKAEELKGITKGIKDAAAIAKDITEEDVMHFSRIVRVMSLVADMIPHTDKTFMEWLLGENRFTNFKTNLADIALGLSYFSKTMLGISTSAGTIGPNGEVQKFVNEPVNVDAVMAGADAIRALASAVSIFSNATTGMSAFDYQDFVDFLEALGGQDTDFIKSGKLDFSWFTSYFMQLGLAVQQGLDDAATKINVDQISTSIITSINGNKGKIAQAMQSAFSDSLFLTPEVDTSGKKSGFTIADLVGGIDTFSKVFGENSEFTKGFESFGTMFTGGGVEKLVGSLSSELNGFQFNSDEFSTWISSLSSEIIPSDGDIDKEVKGLVGDLKTSFDKQSGEIERVGANVSRGLAYGIESMSWLAVNAMTYTCEAVISAARQVFDQHSPSKVFESIGTFNMLGLANATADSSYLAISAVHQAGDNYISEMTSVLSPLSTLLTDGMDLTPVITPVIDLSNVQNGVGAISNMLAARYGMGMTVPSFTRNTQVPNVNDASLNRGGVVDAINARIDELNENIMNMQIVLDTNGLVVGTVAAYDKALGARASKVRRG